jgi:Spy/CpxP family protein refolding chaperone
MFGRLLWAALLAATLAYAQRGGRGGGMGDDMGSMGVMRVRQPTRAQVLADKLKLNKGQKQELQNILMAAAEEAGPLRTQIGNARVQLAGAIIEGKGDQAVKQAQDAYSVLAAQMTGVEAKAFAKIYALLKPNQQSRASQGFELMAGIFQQPGRGRSEGRGEGRGERGR